MATGLRTFTVTELTRDSQGTFTDAATKFEWDAQHQSSPRVGWEFGQKLRTHREDYPGADLPTEQVLGPNFTPFTVHGVWDDRYNSSGYAVATQKAFESLVQRGNFVRVEFEGLTITGLITDAKYNYRRASYIGYEFTLSPHYRNAAGDARQQAAIVPQAISNPQSYVDQAVAILVTIKEIQTFAPSLFTVTTTAEDVATSIVTISDSVATGQAILDNRILVTDVNTQAVNSISRLVQSFVTVQQAASSTLALLGITSSTNGLGYETAANTLAYEVWQRELAFNLRAMVVLSRQAIDDLSRLVAPRTLAYYRPHKGESLYGIANQFYNAPERWRDIYAANNLATITLSGTELLVIPDVR